MTTAPAVRPAAAGAGVLVLAEAVLLWAADAGHEGLSTPTAVALPLLTALALLGLADACRRPDRWTLTTVAAAAVFAALAIPALLAVVHALSGGLLQAD